MTRRIIKALNSSTKPIFFPNPLKQGQYPVLSPLPIPNHIIKPAYATEKNPKFGVYQGDPILHKTQVIQKIKKSAKIASNTLGDTQKFIKSKIGSSFTQQQIDNFVFHNIINQGAYPTPIGFMHFPKSVCVSVNQCIVHGIPSTRPLQKGDKINIDVTVFKDGYHGDNNLTVLFGEARNSQVEDLKKLAQQALYEAIRICKPGVPFNAIGYVLQNFAKKYGIYVCQQFSGHGVGQLLHMPPLVIHKYYPQIPYIMKPGNIFTIQPIFTLYPTENNMEIWKDNFTVISKNNPNAQFQHMIYITQNGCEVLTLREDQKIF